uniref:Zinc finger GRF-type domain-containing protein n=1 Tax=Oryza rufipogon TaxID=4529 RepID=A0A0E0Q0I1_ORYRU
MADQGRSDDEQVESAAGGTSRSKDMTSSGNDSKSSQGGSNPPPIRQREGQFDYSPAILCKCGYNDGQMDFLSGNNPSRRYLTCARARENSEMRACLVSARDELKVVHNGVCNRDVADWTRKLKEKDDSACKLNVLN